MWDWLRRFWEVVKDMATLPWWGRLWEAIKDITLVLWPARFSIGMLIVPIPFLSLLQPSQDALLALVTNRQSSWSQFVFALICLIWALETFYWAQFMSRLPRRETAWRRYEESRLLSDPSLERLNEEFPRVIGALVLVVVCGATIKANWGNSANIGWVLLVAAFDGSLYYVLCWRRDGLLQLRRKAARRAATAVINSNVLRPLLQNVSTRLHNVVNDVANPPPVVAHPQEQYRNLFQPQAQVVGAHQLAPAAPPQVPADGAPAAQPEVPADWRRSIVVLGGILVTLGFYTFSGYFSYAARPAIALGLAGFWLVLGFLYIATINSQAIDAKTRVWVLFNFVLFTAIFICSIYSAEVLGIIFGNVITAPTVTLSVFAA